MISPDHTNGSPHLADVERIVELEVRDVRFPTSRMLDGSDAMNPMWICVGLFAIAGGVLGFTRWGRSLYAIGGNLDAARAAGIRTDRVLWSVLIVASLLAAIGGMLISGRLASVAANQGNGAIFTVFAAAVIGGVSLSGGKGTVFGAFTGILLLYTIQNVLTLGGVPAQWIDALNGGIILVALMVSRITSGRAQE
nr:ABC transporter permease [Candidatus Solirubrobacter pratensis]